MENKNTDGKQEDTTAHDLNSKLNQALWGHSAGTSIEHTCISDWSELQTRLQEAKETPIHYYTSPGPIPTETRQGHILELREKAQIRPPKLDKLSMLLHCDSRCRLDDLESYARISGFTTGFRTGSRRTLVKWLQEGDLLRTDIGSGPAFRIVYSLSALLPNGSPIHLGRGPRASAGPDLRSLFWGLGDCFGIPTQVSLRLRKFAPVTFWEIRFEHYKKAFAFLRDLARHRQLPSEFIGELHLNKGDCLLHLQINAERPTYAQKRVLEEANRKEVPSLPPHLLPFSPWWLACSVDWDTLAELPKLMQENTPLPIKKCTIEHAGHEGLTLLFQYDPPNDIPMAKEQMRQLAAKFTQKKLRVWGDPRLIPNKQLHPGNLELLKNMKEQLDPNWILNPHILRGE